MSSTREEFLVRALVGVGAVAAGPLVATAAAQAGDEGILRFALSLEHLELALWEHGLALGLGTGVRAAVQDLRADDGIHRATLLALAKQDGGTPEYRFGADDENLFLQTAAVVEDLVVGAYNAVAGQARSPEVLTALAGIAAVEGRHAAVMRIGAGLPPAGFAVDEARGRADVRDALGAWRVGS
jgi:hypothetical protein